MAAAKKKPAPETVAPEIESGTALIPIETVRANEVFVPSGTDWMIAIVEAEVAAFVPDLTTEEGRKAISRMNLRIAGSKNAIDKLRTDFTEEARLRVAAVNAEGKRFVTRMEELQEQVSAPLDKWKADEKRRVDDHNNALSVMRSLSDFKECSGEPASAHVQRMIDALPSHHNRAWEDFQELADEAKAEVAAALDAALTRALKREADQAELQKLRDDAAERDRQAEADRVAKEATANAEQKAKDDAEAARVAAEGRVKAEGERAAIAEATAAQAVKDKEKAEADAAQKAIDAAAAATKAEADRQQGIKDAAAAEEKRLADDKAHRGKINKAALAAIAQAAGGITEAQGIAILTAIVKGQVPQVSITYTVKPGA